MKRTFEEGVCVGPIWSAITTHSVNEPSVLALNQPSLAKRVKAAAPEPNGRRRATRPASYVSAS